MTKNRCGNNKVLSEISNTQRISLKPNENSVTILKEFRKDASSDWITSKGIEVSRDLIPSLVETLSNI